MMIHVKRWLQRSESAPDIQTYRTTITVASRSVTVALTIPGRHTRKQAIGRAFDHFNADRQRWSAGFLNELRTHCPKGGKK